MADSRGHAHRAALMDRSEVAARRAAAERARRSATELVAEAGASRQRAEELRRGLEARRLRAARGRGSGPQGDAG
ncbi:hypothetical protein ACI798_09400 [Geodermatophilus sp. SYSU D01045]